MNTQPEALRLADELEAIFGETDIDERVCKELRRLHEVNQMLVEAGEMALAALEAKGDLWIALERKAKETLRQALAQPEQEPIKYKCTIIDDEHPNGIPLEQWGNTAPPKREWVSATHIEIGNLWAKHKEVYGFAIALDKLLQDKNR